MISSIPIEHESARRQTTEVSSPHWAMMTLRVIMCALGVGLIACASLLDLPSYETATLAGIGVANLVLVLALRKPFAAGLHTHRDREVVLQVSPDAGVGRLVDTAVALGWSTQREGGVVKAVEPKSRLRPHWPAHVDAEIRTIDDNRCAVRLSGSVFGYGALAARHLESTLSRYEHALIGGSSEPYA